jgi:hypothetical protein
MIDKEQARTRIYHGLKIDIDQRVSNAKERFITIRVSLTPEQQQLLTALVDSLVETNWSEENETTNL